MRCDGSHVELAVLLITLHYVNIRYGRNIISTLLKHDAIPAHLHYADQTFGGPAGFNVTRQALLWKIKQ